MGQATDNCIKYGSMVSSARFGNYGYNNPLIRDHRTAPTLTPNPRKRNPRNSHLVIRDTLPFENNSGDLAHARSKQVKDRTSWRTRQTLSTTSLPSLHTRPEFHSSIGILQESTNHSSCDVKAAKKLPLIEEVDQPSRISSTGQAYREEFGARSVSILSTFSAGNQSMLDLTRDIPPENMLAVIERRLGEQDKEIEDVYTQSLDNDRLQAYYQFKARTEPRVQVLRSISVPALVPTVKLSNTESEPRHASSGSHRLSESSSNLGPIVEGDTRVASPPPVRRATKPSLESIISTASTPIGLLGPYRHSASNHSSRKLEYINRLSSTSDTPSVLCDVTQQHNTMNTTEKAALTVHKTARQLTTLPHRPGQENVSGKGRFS
jgi:hypothetical protein